MVLAFAQPQRATKKDNFLGNKVGLYWETLPHHGGCYWYKYFRKVASEEFLGSEIFPVDFHYEGESSVILDKVSGSLAETLYVFLWA